MDFSYSLGAVFAAGILSFLSPCVLPLVPPYLCFISGLSLDEMTEGNRQATRRTLLAALLFILGFATVFVAFGASASFIGQVLRAHKTTLAVVAGIAIIIAGLHFLGLFRLGFLSRELRYQTAGRPASLLGAYVVGLAFAFGWTPCIGPVLGAILSVAAASESVMRGVLLLGLYAAGLGVPFLLAALGVERFLAFFRGFRRHLGRIEKIMGALLVIAGIGFITGLHEDFAFWLNQFAIFQSIG